MSTSPRQHQGWLGQQRSSTSQPNGVTNFETNQFLRTIFYRVWRSFLKWPLIIFVVLCLVAIVFIAFSLLITCVFILLDPYVSPLLTSAIDAIARILDHWTSLSPQNLDLALCKARVGSPQAVLFEPEIYFQQYNISLWNVTMIPDHETICATGFVGNPDIYGLGIRLGLYLQWICSFIANCLSEELRETISPANILFALALTAVIFQMGVQNACNFVAEVDIVLLLFVGCFMTTRLWPNLMKPRSSPERRGVTWRLASSRSLYLLILWFASWYWVRGYATHFAQTPCGTTHFIISFIPGRGWLYFMRLYIGLSLGLAAVSGSAIFLITIAAFAREIWKSIYDSSIVQGLFPHLSYEPLPQNDQGVQQISTSQWLRLWRAILVPCLQWLRHFTSVGLIVSPLNAKRRRRNIVQHFVLSVIVFAYCVTGVELTIRWNRITNVNSVNSVGQYIALVIGIGTTIVFMYNVLREKMKKRRPHENVEQDGDPADENIEMDEQ